MTAHGELRERWRAIDPTRNLAREYQLLVTTDLFGWTLVERQWGRIGTAGQHTRTSFADCQDAARLVAAIRQRRASAHRRIGAEYTRIQI